MAEELEIPTLSEVTARVRQDIRDRTEGGDSFLRRSVEGVLALVIAAIAHSLWKFLRKVAGRAIPSATFVDQLLKWCAFFGVDRLLATKASGELVFAATNGTEVPSGRQFTRSDGVLYASTAIATAAGDEVTVPVEAVEAAADGNFDAGATIRFSSPLAGVDAEGVVGVDGLTGGRDLETPQALFQRLLLRVRSPRRGGGPGDYEFWALEVAGVTRAFEVKHKNGVGTMSVAVVDDTKEDITDVDIGVLGAVKDHILAFAPLDADTLEVFTPTALPVDFEMSVVPNTSEVRAAVEAQLVDYFATTAKMGESLPLSNINEAISAAEGETSHDLTDPTADVEPTAYQIPVLGDVVFT